MKKNKANQAKTISNRRARHDFDLSDELTVGVQLTGRETKALRMGHGQLRGAFVTTKDNELYLVNASIHSTNTFRIEEDEQTRSRKLLAKRKEIESLLAAKQQGRTIVPLAFLTQGRYIKLKIAVGKGKKRWDKRATLKKHDQDREAQRQLS